MHKEEDRQRMLQKEVRRLKEQLARLKVRHQGGKEDRTDEFTPGVFTVRDAD